VIKERLTFVEPGFLVIHRTYTDVMGAQGPLIKQDIYKKAAPKRSGRTND
jgi:hypothetical protein